MAFRRRYAKKSATARAIVGQEMRAKKTYEIDGCVYKSKTLRDLHEVLMTNEYVKTFSLPTADVEAKERNKKYGAKKIEINGIVFDSIMEGRFYLYLLQRMADGEVENFDRQITFELQPKFRSKFDGKLIRAINYIADFVVTMTDGTEYVIDVKGEETDTFKIKRKLFEYKYPDKYFMCVQWVARDGKWENLDDIKLRRRENRKAAKASKAKTA